MKKLFGGILLLALALVLPSPTMARLNVGISISLPPPIEFRQPPELIVLPETYVYVVPDAEVDIFFYDGWWWRPWEGRWYRSRDYSSGWVYFESVPSFYVEIPTGWRNDYREQRWRGHQWNVQRIPQQQVQQNWSNWQKNRYWEQHQTWGVQDLQNRTQSQQPSQKIQRQQPQKRQVQQSQPRYREVAPQSQPENQGSKGNKGHQGNKGSHMKVKPNDRGNN